MIAYLDRLKHSETERLVEDDPWPMRLRGRYLDRFIMWTACRKMIHVEASRREMECVCLKRGKAKQLESNNANC